MVRQHSTPWEERADSLKGIRSDYDSMRTKLSIALKKIELMSAEVRTREFIYIIQDFMCKVHWRDFTCGTGKFSNSDFMLRRRG